MRPFPPIRWTVALWVAAVGSSCSRPAALGANNGRGVAAFADGSWIVTGRFESLKAFQGDLHSASAKESDEGDDESVVRSDGNADIFLARYQSDGSTAWVSRAGGTHCDYGEDVAALPDGRCIVTGHFEEEARFGAWEDHDTRLQSAGGADGFLALYQADGTLAWAQRFGGPGCDWGKGVATGTDGTIVLVGRFESNAGFGTGPSGATVLQSAGKRDVFVARFHPDGRLLWVRRLGGRGFDQAEDVAVSSDDSCVVTGSFERQVTFAGQGEPILESAGESDAFAVRLDSCGQLLWSQRLGGREDDTARGVAVFQDGSCAVTGRFGGVACAGRGEVRETQLSDAGNRDVFVARFHAEGTLDWARRAGGIESDYGRAIASDRDGSCIVTGFFRDTAVFGAEEVRETLLRSSGGLDLFVAKWSFDGTLLWARAQGGVGAERGYGIATLPDGSCVIAGGRPLHGQRDADDLWVLRYDPNGDP